MKTFLHVGCGPNRKQHTTRSFAGEDWREVRVDIDPGASPDVVASMTDMTALADESADAIFSAHNIEHLYPHEVPVALKEFLRVLKPEGFLVLTCPDLKSVAELIAQDKLTEPAYHSSAGPITPLDILYGHRPAMAAGNLFMAHRCGFTEKVLTATLLEAGFLSVAAAARPTDFDLWAIAGKAALSGEALLAIAHDHFPVAAP